MRRRLNEPWPLGLGYLLILQEGPKHAHQVRRSGTCCIIDMGKLVVSSTASVTTSVTGNSSVGFGVNIMAVKQEGRNAGLLVPLPLPHGWSPGGPCGR